MAITENVTEVQHQVLDLLNKVQEPVVDAVRKAAEAVDSALPEERPAVPFIDQLPTPAEVIDLSFGFAQQLLDNQKAFATAILAAVSPVLPEEFKPAKPKVAKKVAAA